MDDSGCRQLTSQLGADFGWLETYYRSRPELAAQAGELRLAGSLVRNCTGPYLAGEPPPPLHLVVVGGAGAGKSTVVNLLLGAGAAEANAQAGFTRHPIAYTSQNGELRWPSLPGFLGPLRRLSQPAPANLDEDVYQLRTVPPEPTAASLLGDFIVWDCPDMTTWAATGYVPRLLEIAGLADVILYVASDERYNDEVPTQFLHLLLQIGKPVVVCLMKMKEADAPALLDHFRREVLGRLSREPLACLAIPYLSPERLAEPARLAAAYRIPLLNQVAVLGNVPSAARRHVVQGAARYLRASQNRLLEPARQDVAVLEEWRRIVLAGQREFDVRYGREYLTGEKFRSFDEALVRLLDLLELPGVGKVVSTTLWVVRTPYRLFKGWLGKALTRPEAPGLPELPLLEGALADWLNLLRKEAIRRSARAGDARSASMWAHIEKGFQEGLADRARERFREGFRSFQLNLADEVDRTARAIYEELEKSPVLLNTLRSGNFALDVAAIAGALTIGHFGIQDLILVPLLASVKQQVIELLGQQYVENQREQIRSRQQLLVTQYVSAPLAEWLARWPATGGSAIEQLQDIVERVPPAVGQLDAGVGRAVNEPVGAAS
jgi:hypothetical protein